MLNEWFELSKALEHYGLLHVTTHPNVGNVGKVDCLLIQLDQKGVPKEIRLLQKEETANLWKHSKGNHNSFPAIRLQKPLLSIDESRKILGALWENMKLIEKIISLNTLDFEAINSDSTEIKISDWTMQELTPVLDSEIPELSALKQIIRVFPHKEQCIKFVTALVDLLQKKINVCNNEVELDFIKELLVGSWDDRRKKNISGCMTYYDVYETDNFSNLTISHITKQALIVLLNDLDKSSAVSKNYIVSPLSGKPAEGVGEKYPNPNIPLLGLTYLYSKKSDTPCLMRYKLSGVEAFQAGKADIMAINDSIAFLTSENRKNKSWKAMSDSNQEKPNLLLAYLQDDPLNDALLAQALSDFSDYENEDEYREVAETAFDALCQQVIGCTNPILQKNPMSQISFILLETLDPGRKQIVYSNTLTVERFQSNLADWSEAVKNHPEIGIRIRDKKEIHEYKSIYPGPDNICQLLKINYTHSSSAKPMKHSAISLHEIYRLYMPQNDKVARDIPFLNEILMKVIQKSSHMLGDVGHQMTSKYALPSTNEARKKAKQTAAFISLISILLWRLGVRKEDYMLEVPFNVGQFLQLSDMLHKEYCIQVRNGGKKDAPLPPQLIGNDMLAITSENPIEGLNRLRDRMKIYLAWANTTTGEDAGLAKWILIRYSEVSTRILAYDIPEQFNAAEQAQVLLGYLAKIQYEKKTEKEDQSNA